MDAHTHPDRDERGAIAPLVLVMLSAAVVLVGLVHDGGAVFAARRSADATAAEAARAAAIQLDADSLYDVGSVRVDPSAARRAAAMTIARSDFVPASTPSVLIGPEQRSVIVTVETTVAFGILGVVGLTDPTVVARREARVAGSPNSPAAR